MPKILIVESEPPLAKTLSEAFQKKGMTSVLTGDGGEALNLARSERPQLIILCVELPRGSGYSVCNKLKKDPELAAIPLILTSAQATEETFEQHKKLRTRAEAYLKKPYGTDELLMLAMEYLKGTMNGVAAPAKDEMEVEVSVDDLSVDTEDAANQLSGDDEALKTTAMRVPDATRLAAASAAASTARESVVAEPSEEAPAAAPRRPTTSLVSDAEGERLRGEVRQLRQKVQRLEQTLQEKELEFNDRLLQESSRGRESVEIKKKLQVVERDIAKHQQIAEKATAEAEKYKTEFNRLKQEADVSEQDRQLLSDKMGQLVDKVKQLAAERDKLQAELTRLDGEHDVLKADVESAQKVKEKARKAVDIAVQLINETGLVQ